MILIVGGAGYIGSHVNKLLSQKGYQTIVLDNLQNGYREFVKWGEFILGDLSYKEQIRLCFKKYPIESVMHFSAFAYVGESVKNPGKYYLNNVCNTLNLLEVMKEFQVKYFIFSSSCSVYGSPQKIPIEENTPKEPINPYGRTKLMIETILKDYDSAYGIKHINLRYFNAAGADPEGEIGERHNPETHLIPLTIYTALGKREFIEVYGTNYPTKDGTCIRDFIHVVDLADAHIKALEYLLTNNKSNSFNIGLNKGYSVYDVIRTVKQITGKDFKIKKSLRRKGDPPILIADSSKARKFLKWKPHFTELSQIITTAWAWHSKDLFSLHK